VTTIKTSCFICGDVELRAPMMSLHIFENALDRSYYSFRCPNCGDKVVKSADDECIELLSAAAGAGLIINRVTIPDEALEQHVGWIITPDDVLDFTLSLREMESPLAILLQETQDSKLRPTG